MDSTDVNRSIRSIVRPVLKAEGFEVVTARSAWRHHGETIHVVNFQSFNRYNADVLGCSTFSFAVNLAVYVNAIPAEHPISVRAGRVCPHEYDSHIRRRLLPRSPLLPKAPDIWVIEESGRNLEETVRAVTTELEEVGLPWLAAFQDLPTVLGVLRDRVPSPDRLTWLPGNTDSPARNRAVGYVALALGEKTIAAEHLRRALDQLRAFDSDHEKKRLRMPKMVPRALEETVLQLERGSA